MRLFEKKIEMEPLDLGDDALVGMFDGGRVIDTDSLESRIFADELLGPTIAFTSDSEMLTVCSPANGTLTYIYPDAHSFVLKTNRGPELFIHIGLDTVEAHGSGLSLQGFKTGDAVRAGDPIVSVDMKKMKKAYDMPIIMVVTDNDGKKLSLPKSGVFDRGEPLNRKN